MDWVALSGDPTDETTPEHSLLEHLGISPNTSLKEFGLIEAEDYSDELKEWTYGGKKPAVFLRSKSKALGHFSGIFVGSEYTKEQTMEYDALEQKHQRALALKAAIPARVQVQQQAVAQSSGGRIARFKDITDAARTGEVDVIDFTKHTEAIKRYKLVMHAKKVPENCEPSSEQLAILGALLKEQNIPYVDFALRGPYARRIIKTMSGMGLAFSADGKLDSEQFKGAPSLMLWKKCWLVFQTATT